MSGQCFNFTHFVFHESAVLHLLHEQNIVFVTFEAFVNL